MTYDFSLIRRLIQERGLTFREIQDRTGINYTTISKALDRDTAHPSTAKALARFFRVPLRNLLAEPERKRA